MESLAKAFGVSVSLLAGFVFLRVSPFRRYRAEHLRTDRFALHVFGFSIICYSVGVAIASIVAYKFPGGFVDNYLHKFAKYLELDVSVLCTLAVAPFLGLLDRLCILVLMCRDPAVKKRPWRRLYAKSAAAAVARFISKCDDAAIQMLYRATFYRKPIMLTLKNGKVYVGTPVKGIGDPSVRANFFKILPMLSGYRDPDTHKVELPTKYRDITFQMQPRQNKKPSSVDDPLEQDIADLKLSDEEQVVIDMQDMGVVILWSEIVTLSLYDENIYRAFQAVGPPPEKNRLTLFGKDGLLARLFLC
jgi:hypothetical protein